MVGPTHYLFRTLVLLFLNFAAGFHNLDYSDLQALGVLCPPHDSCVLPSNKTIYTANCKCDPLCYEYNDCCIDAPRYSTVRPQNIPGLMCFPDFDSPHGVYAISKCLSNYTGPMSVKNKCERSNNRSDPMMAAPAVDTIHNVTYRNRYCSECNNVSPSNLQSWVISVECNSVLNSGSNMTEEDIWDNLVYKTTYPHRNKWGLYLWSTDRERDVFHPCRLTYKLPGYLEEHSRYCMPDVVSSCSPTWRRNVIRQNCESYTSLVFTETQILKNPHCALCNNVNLTSLMCPFGLHSRRKPPMSFTLLLDVNLNDGNKVGQIQRCPDGQKYDAFFKKCRQLKCALPGYRLEGETCVRI